MKRLTIGLVICLLIMVASCTVNRPLTLTQGDDSYDVILVGEDTYAIKLERIAKITEDSTLISNYSKAASYLHSINDTIDIYKSTRKVIQRGTLNIIKSVKLENQSGTDMLFHIWVDRDGVVVASKYDSASTAVLDDSQKATVVAQSLNYKIEKDQNAPLLQKGKIKITLDDINAFGGF